MGNQLDLHSASLYAALLLRKRASDLARPLCDQVLSLDRNHPQGLMTRLCVAWADGDRAHAHAVLDRLLDQPDALQNVPLFKSGQEAPKLIDGGLQSMFGSAVPPVSDVSDHIGDIFYETLVTRPRLIVELGTRGGESTKALLAAAVRCGAPVLSLDIDACSPELPEDAKALWTFVQQDDVSFGKERFAGWCADRGLPAEIDVLYIDTSHLYEHTRDEVAVWLPFVAPGGVALFHDTNLWHYTVRGDGSIDSSWDNDRGVIRAIEEHIGFTIDEKSPTVGIANGWAIRHNPKCNGFTVLRRLVR